MRRLPASQGTASDVCGAIRWDGRWVCELRIERLAHDQLEELLLHAALVDGLLADEVDLSSPGADVDEALPCTARTKCAEADDCMGADLSPLGSTGRLRGSAQQGCMDPSTAARMHMHGRVSTFSGFLSSSGFLHICIHMCQKRSKPRRMGSVGSVRHREGLHARLPPVAPSRDCRALGDCQGTGGGPTWATVSLMMLSRRIEISRYGHVKSRKTATWGKMWQGRAQSWRKCGRGEPSPGADAQQG